MRIKEIRAFEIELNPQPQTPLREPSRAETIKMTRPMARYSQARGWDPQWKRPAVIVTAEDGTWGFGLSVHGGPVVSIINDHFAPFLVGENCMATGVPGNLTISSKGTPGGETPSERSPQTTAGMA